MDCHGLHLAEGESEAPDLKLQLCPVRPGLLSHCDLIPGRSSISPPLKRTAPFDNPSPKTSWILLEILKWIFPGVPMLKLPIQFP